MWHDSNISPVYLREDVTMSPVLLAALSHARVNPADLVSRTVAGRGRLVLGSDPVADAALLEVGSKWSSVDRTGSSIDFCTRRIHTGMAYECCEAHTLPLLKLRGMTLSETIVSSLPGRRMSTVIDGLFEALRLADPIIETAESSSEEECDGIPLVSVTEWVTVPLSHRF